MLPQRGKLFTAGFSSQRIPCAPVLHCFAPPWTRPASDAPRHCSGCWPMALFPNWWQLWISALDA